MVSIKPIGRVLVLAGAALILSCSSSSQLSIISGTVTVDNEPVETGTIHFQPSGDTAAAGAAVTAGKFELRPKVGLTPGEYSVALRAYRKTGRIVNDPQRGKVPETAAVDVIDSPKVVKLSYENANDLKIYFSTSKK
jgi:hypothetical protein